ncbi:sel1 repeat family protein [Vibrio aestuarianus]|uniref:sel1 repeat family protein n=1 Tax=Vibrio aestuarianus TaxID=28171 RepID=UPI00237C847E|nr:sel1 repeat family protein [Vibrio aestuarianus]MDE1266139.1 sel1 repeat family protein [Vibrio aestuarianus]MDE1298301.1 sel1 repeat family protein [Vibrio aestuarianus]
MTLYLNRLVRLVLLLSVMVGLVACKPNPLDDIALFQSFITENINKKSDDPYISSTVKPGDKMYDILVNIQHGRHDSASNKLQAMIEENDIDAMVWYAKLIYRASINNRPKALSLYQTAMEDDNPYAYIMLSPGLISSGCARYFGEKNCTQEHFNRAIELFKPLAAQGDLRAQYFLLKQQELEQSKETRAQYIQEVVRFSQAHYYQPLMDYVNTILIYSPSKGKSEAKTPEQYQLAIQLLTIAANNNYIPALKRRLEVDVDEETFNQFMEQLTRLGSTFEIYENYFNSLDEYERYYYSMLFKRLTGDNKLSSSYTPTDEELSVISEKIEKTINSMSPMVYIDGFTSRDDWVD